MNNLTYIILLCLFSINYTYAQDDITGTLQNEADGSGLAYATVTLLQNDSSVVTGTMTDGSGLFVLKDLKPGKYLLFFSYLGYEKKYLPVNIPEQSQLGLITLSESHDNKLKEVVVTADRQFVVQRSDRYIVNVGNYIQTGGRNALEVLSNTPGVLATPDGELSVMGRSVNIYIDGRPSNLSGEQLKALLTSTQGENIDRIEVITNPSARYEASGGSIIDIKTKKGLPYGINGSVNVAYRQGHKDKETGGMNLNYRTEHINIYGNYSLDRSHLWQQISQENGILKEGIKHSFNQRADNKSIDPLWGQQYKVGVDYLINKKHTVGTLFTGYHTNDAENEINSKTLIYPALGDTVYSKSDSKRSSWNDGKEINLNYQGQLAKPGQQINVDIDYGKFKSNPYQLNTNQYYNSIGIQIGNNEQLQHSNPQTIDIWSAKVDYIQPLRENLKIEFGGKMSKSKTDNNLIYEKYLNSNWEIDLNQSNRFVYTEHIDAGYLSSDMNIGKWELKVGLRGEYTHSKGDLKTMGKKNKSSYFNLFPSVFVTYSPTDDYQLNVSYGRRISRPAYSQLNPFEVTIDAYSFTSGNPDLKPTITDNISIAASHSSGIMLEFAYDIIKDVIITSPIQRGDKYGLKFENYGKIRSLTVMLNYKKIVTKFWTFNLMLQGEYTRNFSVESYGELKDNGFTWYGQLYNSFNITSSFYGELTAMYSASQKYAYYDVKPRSNVTIGLRKMLLKDKLSISFSANDIFNRFITDMKAKNEGIDYHVKIKRDSRWINLGLRYIFGSDKVKSNRNRSTGLENETQRVK